MLYLMGALGAILYGSAIFVKDYEVKGIKSSSISLGFVVFTGAVCGGVLTPFIGHKYPWLVEPATEPLALAIGLLANPILPIVIDKGKSFAEIFFGKIKG